MQSDLSVPRDVAIIVHLSQAHLGCRRPLACASYSRLPQKGDVNPCNPDTGPGLNSHVMGRPPKSFLTAYAEKRWRSRKPLPGGRLGWRRRLRNGMRINENLRPNTTVSPHRPRGARAEPSLAKPWHSRGSEPTPSPGASAAVLAAVLLSVAAGCGVCDRGSFEAEKCPARHFLSQLADQA